MKRILFLFAGLVALSTTAFATNNTTTEAEASINNYVRGYGNSFIFNEAGIEFSIFADGQFDFYMPNYGPNVNIGINSPGFNLSFNSGFDYNPYLQYDSFGAIVQIENTPIFYDHFGRVNQVGNIFVNYNGFGRINRIGGLNIHYRNNIFWRHDGFINNFNRGYVYRPWHRFYAVPNINFCIINVNPYRQFYAPVRHIYYRPYNNNVRHYNVNGRRSNAQLGRRSNTTRVSDTYVQHPRNNRERSIRRTATRSNTTIASTRATRLSSVSGSNRNVASNNNSLSRTNDRATSTSSNTRTIRSNENANTTTSNSRSLRSTSTERSRNTVERSRNTRENVTRTRTGVSNKVEARKSPSVRKPNATKSRIYNKARTQPSVSQNKRKSSSVTTKARSSRSNNSSTRSNSRRSRG
ncbi:hypothetical protein [uncultured Winogradskyella sp.]|mgnify:CR=1 FL=1|uniref:hypothetical protein n=1 Tax=uncultured Winogradskyella sp. TaxID=395353 RepID=UPI0030D9A384